MKHLEIIKNSIGWDTDNDLPTVPASNNPWLYMAYSTKLIRFLDNSPDWTPGKLPDFIKACEIEPGLINRWPNNRGGTTSHDELLGACYLDGNLANRVSDYLNKTDGVYNNTNTVWLFEDRFNVYRIYWVASALRACTSYRFGIFHQIVWCINLLHDMWTQKSGEIDAGGRLRIWIQLEKVNKYPLCRFVTTLWQNNMRKKNIYLSVCLGLEVKWSPALAELAPIEFFVGGK